MNPTLKSYVEAKIWADYENCNGSLEVRNLISLVKAMELHDLSEDLEIRFVTDKAEFINDYFDKKQQY